MSTPEYQKLISQIAKSWAAELALSPDRIKAQNFSGHLLAEELRALFRGEASSLPYFSGKEVVWMTVAPNAENLTMAIDELRAWILPSHGWEDDDGHSVVLPEDAPNVIKGFVGNISPSGYFRWKTKREKFNQAIQKLNAMRQTSVLRPAHQYIHVPSLFELRQQYEIALIIKDRASAQSAINRINFDQLDTAANTGFMQIRLWSEFHEYEKIVDYEQLQELVQLRMPHLVRLDIINAFHDQFLKQFEVANNAARSTQSYTQNVQSFLEPLLGLCRPSDGLVVSHCLGYKAVLYQDSKLANELLKDASDEFLQDLLKSFRVVEVMPPAVSLVAQFQTAHRKNDWRALQEVGEAILFATVTEDSDLPRDYLLANLRYSLNFRANPKLQGKLSNFAAKTRELKTPQSWLEFADIVREKQWQSASVFLALDDRPRLGDADLATSLHFLETFEELFTDPELETDRVGKEVLQSALPSIIREFLTVPEFPKSDLTSIYRQLMLLWATYKSGSSVPVDANLLLTLAEPVLQNDGDSESLVAETLRQWWEARRVRALLPFLLSALEILSENISITGICENLWIDGAEFVRTHPESLSQTELKLWRFIGAKIGLDDETISEFLGADVIITDAVDLLSALQVERIAIVSLQVEAAQNAAELIRQRIASEVIVVSETQNNSAVENAKNSDVILFVWASNTHAVYRAFDNSREKLVYVQGKGASSIIISLEKWASKTLKHNY